MEVLVLQELVLHEKLGLAESSLFMGVQVTVMASMKKWHYLAHSISHCKPNIKTSLSIQNNQNKHLKRNLI